MTHDKDALLREARDLLVEMLGKPETPFPAYTVGWLAGRITAALEGDAAGGWMPLSGKYEGEICHKHPKIVGPDGRTWSEALETVSVLVQRPHYLEAQIARLWLKPDRTIQTSFPCNDAIRWQPLPPLPKTERSE